MHAKKKKHAIKLNRINEIVSFIKNTVLLRLKCQWIQLYVNRDYRYDIFIIFIIYFRHKLVTFISWQFARVMWCAFDFKWLKTTKHSYFRKHIMTTKTITLKYSVSIIVEFELFSPLDTCAEHGSNIFEIVQVFDWINLNDDSMALFHYILGYFSKITKFWTKIHSPVFRNNEKWWLFVTVDKSNCLEYFGIRLLACEEISEV